jgi:DNA repair photolyase
MDHAAWLRDGLDGADEELKKSYQYFMRVDPDQRDFLGPIETVDDLVTGKRMRCRTGRVGMVRGAKEENMKGVQIWMDPLPHVRIEKGKDLQGWYQGKQLSAPGSRVRPCMTDAILTEPYGGFCTVGCSFCYINSGFRGYRGSGLITVPIGYGDHVAKQLRSMRISAAGYFSSFTDPFLPLESYYHNTEDGVKAFTNEGLPIFFLSRLAYPDWAIDALRLNKFSYAQKSINTPDPDDWKKLSPGALPLMDHLEEIRKLHEAGIYISIQVNPIIAGVVTHEDIERLFGMLAEAGTDHVIVKFVEANHPWANAMVERITKRFGDNRAAAFRDLFIENSCGGQKTVTEEYRREGHTRYRKRATELGMTYSLCYEYTNRSGVWKSMGPEFITSDQCHGHQVPVHTRKDAGEPFKALGECPPSGCLSCADTNAGKPRCGSELLGAAKALRLVDLRKDPLVKRKVERYVSKTPRRVQAT